MEWGVRQQKVKEGIGKPPGKNFAQQLTSPPTHLTREFAGLLAASDLGGLGRRSTGCRGLRGPAPFPHLAYLELLKWRKRCFCSVRFLKGRLLGEQIQTKHSTGQCQCSWWRPNQMFPEHPASHIGSLWAGQFVLAFSPDSHFLGSQTVSRYRRAQQGLCSRAHVDGFTQSYTKVEFNPTV